MNRVKYHFRADVSPIFRGDTLEAMSFHLAFKDGTPIIPESVCAQIMDNRGKPVHVWTPHIDRVSGVVSLAEIKDTFEIMPFGMYTYGVKYTLSDGFSRNYFGGSITILGGAPICKN